MLFVIVAGLMVPVTGLGSLLATLMGATGSAWLECFHLSMPSPNDLLRVLYQPVCSML